MKNLFLILFFSIPVALSAQFMPGNATSFFYGATNGNDGARLVTINEATATVTDVGNLQLFGTGININRMPGFGITSTGELYGVGLDAGFPSYTESALYRIDANSGEAEQIGATFTPQRGATFDLNDVLWSVNHGSSNTALNNINLTTGVITQISTPLPAAWWGPMATDPTTGMIYVYNWSADAIWVFDPVMSSAASLAQATVALPAGSVSSMFFDVSGNLYLGTGSAFPGPPSLYQYDLINSMSTLVSAWSGFNGTVGNESVSSVGINTSAAPPPPVPTLGEWGLIILLLVVLVFGVVMINQKKAVLFKSK